MSREPLGGLAGARRHARAEAHADQRHRRLEAREQKRDAHPARRGRPADAQRDRDAERVEAERNDDRDELQQFAGAASGARATIPRVEADGIFSGGGIKGLAFAGALTAAAQAGYDRWADLAGTSAGAITAMALAVGYDASALLRLFSFDFSRLDDRGGPFGLGVIENYFHHGITRGKALTDWIEQLLDEAPVPARTFGELGGRLKVIGSDLVHARMVVFPDDVGKYLDDDGKPFEPDAFPVATAVRISAGFPGFFPPVALRDAATGTDGALVDGGVTSGFPVFLFDRPQPRRPTWAFRLYGGSPPEKKPSHPIEGPLWPVAMLGDIIDTAINARDEFELKYFGNRVIAIPTGSVSTLNFSLTNGEKETLYDSGYSAAKTFFAAPDPTNRFGARPPIQRS